MSTLPVIGADRWYEVRKLDDGVNLIHEPWIKPFYRCNMWHVQGRDVDLLFDTGLGHFPLRSSIAALRERPVICVASHSHFDHIGCHHEFDQRCIHADEAEILACREAQGGDLRAMASALGVSSRMLRRRRSARCSS